MLSAIISLAIAISLTGCAQTRLSHEPGLVSRLARPQPALKEPSAPTLFVVLHTRYLEFDKPADPSVAKWWSKHKVRHQLEDVIGEFPFLRLASPEAPTSPPRLLIEATHALRGHKTLNALSRMTHGLIPSSATGCIELDATLSRDGQPLKRYEAVGRYRLRRHLIFFAMPFLWGYKVPAATMEDTFRDLFLQVQQDLPTLFPASGGAT
ncbi:MAG TPA: hypothetical protein DDX89_00550 [Candidatus Omnitrophica bacterium]|nr:MAG: hypothetical protein A2Z92_02535 [Omnitrophica WOR_2 bacterium GWA2_63_20]OGX16419.1 MAG: hypothetical protein A2105_06995 [Omnitrophica WOR_2 bacterium GWF2_63_9]OGX36869.1 MAG: hypothetical protein A3B73_03570 [Omnitrophica WOR_2 bacterium RIFCSPHIGHO2_02_FULL_63_39]OGX44502.1 MAG: hypothetical protein A3I71_02665 [Omnitrophica WOR_2 bacterium RIFCSPLOWO2_02_FULL_63_16]OGX50108.1 MAG: hypothetical protein A3G88_02415 [Omnitrophica WOR_2 bacterium RIFCSPLOWO2_12_FULL_63_16]HAM40945.1 